MIRPARYGVRVFRVLQSAAVLCCLTTTAATIDHDRLTRADSEPGSWLTHGRTYSETRESPLTQINPDTIDRLGLAWYFNTSTQRGLEASPLVIDGVLYTTGSWSTLFALDAATGELLWSFDPQVPRAWGVNACCDVVNRGVAAWGDLIFLGALDGRLIALDRSTGAVRWETLTIDPTRPYTITGAPRVIKGHVIIGNGGAEYGVRGYVSAYDAATGALDWRFYTVPGNPAEPFESDAMRKAAETWTGDLYWKVGGGGTVWDSMAYDPELDLLYIGVGNGAPWNRYIRSPEGGDNLFLSSIVALDPDSGDYVWHYQTTPGDTWDYTATQHMNLADLTLDGRLRKVLMQAPKNGFFYVLDRETGELLSAEKYFDADWASHVDMATGRPVETARADHSQTMQITRPAPFGGHNWHPMAFNQATGLVYIPALSSSAPYSTAADFTYLTGGHWNTGQDATEGFPLPESLMQSMIRRLLGGSLLAWDPVTGKEVWRIEHPTTWNGGVLTTASGLVFQGTGDGRLVAYRADSGARLWESPTQTGVVAPPISYEIDGIQYLAVMAGWGGGAPVNLNIPDAAPGRTGRLLVYRLDGTATLPPMEPEEPQAPLPQPPARIGSSERSARGQTHYEQHCARCHGVGLVSSRLIPDLRWLAPEKHQIFRAIVLDGVLRGTGMVGFRDVLTETDADDIQAYVLDAANDHWETQQQPAWWRAFTTWLMDGLAAVIAWFVL